jgi:hypothetical protein
MDNGRQLKKICKKCEFRRNAHNGAYYYGDSRALSRCAYLEITDEIRGCTPTDTECKKFKPRMRTNSLSGRHEVIG